VTIKNAVVWNVALCRSCVNRRFGLQSAATCSSWFLALGFFYPEDGYYTFPRNAGSYKIYTAQHPRRRLSSLFSSFIVLFIKRFRKLFYFLICFMKCCLRYPHVDFATERASSPVTACGSKIPARPTIRQCNIFPSLREGTGCLAPNPMQRCYLKSQHASITGSSL
jgi:hypothetical protein